MSAGIKPGSRRRWPAIALLALSLPGIVAAAEYEVGPGRSLREIEEVPWEKLEPGDTVSIHHRPEPYRAKWVICRRGTERSPITVRGISGPGGRPPVIDGRDAVTRSELNYWHEERSIIKIGGANHPPDLVPAHIVIENLEVRSGRPPWTFTGRQGRTAYHKNAAAIFISKGEHITLRNCILHDCGNGFMTSPKARGILVEKCHLFDNGIEGSAYEHNAYTEAAGMIYQFNRFGPLREGCRGNNLKDRSAGTVIRSNWIEGGNRQLDLVDAEGAEAIRNDPRYARTLVHGNVLIELDGEDNNQIVHYGGDSGKPHWYRPGTLYFYNNTVISLRSRTTTLFRLSSDDQKVECFNNIFFTAARGRSLALHAGQGSVDAHHNWFKKGWVTWHGGPAPRNPLRNGNLAGSKPGFVAPGAGDFRLLPGSPCARPQAAAAPLPPGLPLPEAQYVPHRKSAPRKAAPGAGPLSLGALEPLAP